MDNTQYSNIAKSAFTNPGNSQYITLCDVGQHSTRMRCYFHCWHNHFFDYFHDPVLDGAVIYAGDIQFWYSEQEGMYRGVLDNYIWNVFLAVSRTIHFY